MTQWKRSILLAGGVALALSLVARAQPVRLNVKLGLWEATSTSTMSGMPPIDLDKMNLTPEQRAMMEQKMGAMAKAMGAPHTSRTCLTQEKLNKPLFQNEDKDCAYTVVSSTPTLEDVNVECSNPNRKTSGNVRIEAVSPESVNVVAKMTVAQDGKTMNVNVNTAAKWVGSACGDVK